MPITASQVGTRPTKVGDVLKHESATNHGYCRELRTVSVVAGMEVGAVLENATSPGTLLRVATATVANASAVLIDDSVYDKIEEGAGDYELAVLVRGECIVADDSLSYTATVSDPNKVIAQDALEALGIVVREQV